MFNTLNIFAQYVNHIKHFMIFYTSTNISYISLKTNFINDKISLTYFLFTVNFIFANIKKI